MKSYIWLGLALAALAFFSVHALAGGPAEVSPKAEPATSECCDLPCDPIDCSPADCLPTDCSVEECGSAVEVLSVECCDDLECPPACCDLPCDPSDCAPSDCLTDDCPIEECGSENQVAVETSTADEPICNGCPGVEFAKTVWSKVAH